MRLENHIIQKDCACDECGTVMPRGFSGIEDDDANLFCSFVCAEKFHNDDDNDDDE